MSINREDKIKYLRNLLTDNNAYEDLFGWLVDNWDSIDFSNANDYLANRESILKEKAISSLKTSLKDLGETDPYLDK